MTDPRGQIADAVRQLAAIRTDLMLDEGRATRPGGDDGPLDPVTAMPTEAPAALVYEGRCAVADPTSALHGTRTVNDEAGAPNRRALRLPLDSPDLLPGDLFEVTATALAPGLVGAVFTVVAEDERSFATYRRYLLRGSSWEEPT